ncbi:hypothetical protein C8Q70DRAFT_122941 [Cubamyces menziesii]|nr:hypothetical protein C8Q70DRAFT_122941 [Cubamyces menziesii]
MTSGFSPSMQHHPCASASIVAPRATLTSSFPRARHRQRPQTTHIAPRDRAVRPRRLDHLVNKSSRVRIQPLAKPRGAALRRSTSDTPTITGTVDGRRVSDAGLRAGQQLACSRLDPWCGPLVAVGRLAALQSEGGAAKQRLNGDGGSVGRADNSPQCGRRTRAVGPPSPGVRPRFVAASPPPGLVPTLGRQRSNAPPAWA